MERDRRETPATRSETFDAEKGRASRTFVREAAGLLRAGASVLLVGGPGMGCSHALPQVVQEAFDDLVLLLVVHLPMTPFRDPAERVRGLHEALAREVSLRAGADAIWEGVDGALRQRASGAPAAGSAAGFSQLWETLGEVAEAAGSVLVVIDGLRRWMPPKQDDAEVVEAVAGLRDLLESTRPATLRLLATDTPDIRGVEESPLDELLLAVDPVALQPMTEAEVRQLLRETSPELDQRDAAHIYRMVGGHPRLARLIGRHFLGWRLRRGAPDDETRVSLTAAADRDIRRVVERAVATLRRMGEGELIDRLFEAAATAEAAVFAPRDLTVLWPLGLIDATDRIPERLRAVIARGSAVARSGSSMAVPVEVPAPSGREQGPGSGLDLGDPALDLGRKERLLFNYLRRVPGEPVPWAELAAAYFAGDASEADALRDEDKAMRTIRGAVNRINAKLAPSPRAAKSGWKVIRYRRGGRGFYVDPEALESIEALH